MSNMIFMSCTTPSTLKSPVCREWSKRSHSFWKRRELSIFDSHIYPLRELFVSPFPLEDTRIWSLCLNYAERLLSQEKARCASTKEMISLTLLFSVENTKVSGSFADKFPSINYMLCLSEAILYWRPEGHMKSFILTGPETLILPHTITTGSCEELRFKRGHQSICMQSF